MRIVLTHEFYGRVIMADGSTFNRYFTNFGKQCATRCAGFITSDGTFVNLPIYTITLEMN